MVAGFGPCVLPMLPAVFGYVTGQVAESPGISPGTGVAQGAGALGDVRAGHEPAVRIDRCCRGLLGRALFVGAWAYYVVAAICVVLGLQMLGVINLPFDALNRFLPDTRPERRGFVGALLFGILFGVVASPCSTPILAAIATIAAARGSVPQGASAAVRLRPWARACRSCCSASPRVADGHAFDIARDRGAHQARRRGAHRCRCLPGMARLTSEDRDAQHCHQVAPRQACGGEQRAPRGAPSASSSARGTGLRRAVPSEAEPPIPHTSWCWTTHGG